MRLILSNYEWGTVGIEATDEDPQGVAMNFSGQIAELLADESPIGATIIMRGEAVLTLCKELFESMPKELRQQLIEYVHDNA